MGRSLDRRPVSNHTVPLPPIARETWPPGWTPAAKAQPTTTPAAGRRCGRHDRRRIRGQEAVTRAGTAEAA
jgi:hypothetical protein